MAIYRGPGGSGDATNDATSQSIIATQAAIEAAESAIQAAASAVSASNSATAASNSASAASTSATNASNFADDAADYATAAASALDEFTDLYLGAKTTNPSLDNDGNALQTGALYFNTVANEFRAYTGIEWQVITVGAVGDSVITQRFSGDGNTVAFTLSTEPFSENSTFVYINGAYQQKNTYSVSGLTLTFSEAPPSGTDNIEVLTITMVDIDNITASIINIADAGGYYASSKVEGALQEAATFTQSGTGAVLRTKTDKLKETVSVKDFGAVGDGVTDDTQAIQDALDTENSVYFPDGNYVVTDLTLSSNNVTIYGSGTIVKKANVDGVVLTITGNNNIVTGLRFDGTAPTPTQNYTNDIIQIPSGELNIVSSCTINGSNGGGISVRNSKNNKIINNTVLNTHDNNILIAGGGADNNLVSGNYCVGTTSQNNIFTCASLDSSPTGEYIYGNQIIGNYCADSGDTAIESGYHSFWSVISNNICINSVNPNILVRDGSGVSVNGNVVINKPYAAQISTHDGIAVVPQNESSSYTYTTRISNNIVMGAVKRSGIYVGGSYVVVSENTIYDNTTSIGANGSGLVGTGVTIAGAPSDVNIERNYIRRFANAISFNYGGTPITGYRLKAIGNSVFEIDTFANCYNVTFDDCDISDNSVKGVVTAAINLTNASGAGKLKYINNRISLPYFTGVSPVEVNPASAIRTIPVLTDVKSVVVEVPETQYQYAVIVISSNQMAGTCTIQFADGSEVATFAIGGATGVGTNTTAKLIGTSGLLDSTGSGGGTGWALFYDAGGDLILQRRGATTGSSTRYLKAVVRDAG